MKVIPVVPRMPDQPDDLRAVGIMSCLTDDGALTGAEMDEFARPFQAALRRQLHA